MKRNKSKDKIEETFNNKQDLDSLTEIIDKELLDATYMVMMISDNII